MRPLRMRRVSVTRSLLAAAVVATAVVLPLAGAAGAEGERMGDAVLIDAQFRSRELREGHNDTVFSIRLPAGASCPGDSANDNWRVQSFLVPAAERAGEIQFALNGPEGGLEDDRWALYIAGGQPFTQQLTLRNDGPGQPGVIDLVPPMIFPYDTERLPPGRYRLGIACTPTPGWNTVSYWDNEIEVVADDSVKPNGLRWTVVGVAAPPADDAGGSSRASLLWVLGSGAALVGAVVLYRRRSRSSSRAATLVEEGS